MLLGLRNGIGLALVILALVRAFILVSHEPMLGYANQHDMFRTSACIGLYPNLETSVRAHALAPLPLYHRGAASDVDCYPSTEVAFDSMIVAAAVGLDADPDKIRLQWIGYAKVALLSATTLAVVWALRKHAVASLIHGAIMLLVVSDPVVTLWFNSLYTEFFVFWGLYAAIAAATVVVIREAPPLTMWMLLIAGAVALAFSREQFAFLPPLLVVAAGSSLWKRSTAMTLAALVISLSAAYISFALTPRPEDVHRANRIDTYLGLVANSSSEPLRALSTLGLPDPCARLVGVSYYDPRAAIVDEECREVFGLSSIAFLRLLITEPFTLARSIAKALPAMQCVSIGYLGTTAGDEPVSFHWLPWWASSPIDAVSARLTSVAFAYFVLVSCLLVPLAAIASWPQPRDAPENAAIVFAILLGSTIAYTLVTSVFGDGLSEIARHFIAGSLSIYALLIAAGIGAVKGCLGWRLVERKQMARPTAGSILSTAVVALLCVGAVAWAKRQPLAIGALDPPATRAPASGQLRVSGWALDPFGVDNVEVHLGTLTKPADYGAARVDVQWRYPGYPDASHSWFKVTLTSEDFLRAGAPGNLPLRVTIKGRSGAVTELDRRTVEITPP